MLTNNNNGPGVPPVPPKAKNAATRNEAQETKLKKRSSGNQTQETNLRRPNSGNQTQETKLRETQERENTLIVFI